MTNFAPCGWLGVDSMLEKAAKGSFIWSMFGCVEMGTFPLSTLWIGFSDMIHDSMLFVVTWDISCTCWKFRQFLAEAPLESTWSSLLEGQAKRINMVIHVILTTDCIGRFLGQLGWYLLECTARLESSTPLQRLADSSQWGCWLVLGNHAGDGPRFLRNRVVVSHIKMWWWKSKAHRFYTKISPFEITEIVLYIPIIYIYIYIQVITCEVFPDMSRLVSCDRSFTCEGWGTSYIGCCHVGGWARSPKRLGSRDVFWIHLWRSIFLVSGCVMSEFSLSTASGYTMISLAHWVRGSWILITVVSSQHVWLSWIFDHRTQL